jgi:hypothetical protein
MKRTLKMSALAIAGTLAAVETAVREGDMEKVNAALIEHHSTLNDAIEHHATELDFDDQDLEEIRAVPEQARGGTPKPTNPGS